MQLCPIFVSCLYTGKESSLLSAVKEIVKLNYLQLIYQAHIQLTK